MPTFTDAQKTEVWDRAEFLEARRRQYRHNISQWEKMGKPKGWIVLEPPVAIFCDDCSAEIKEMQIHVVRHGRKAVCCPCFSKYLPGGPLDD